MREQDEKPARKFSAPMRVETRSLAVLDVLRRPVWIFDLDGPAFWWGNRAALVFWEVNSLAEFQALDCSDLSPAGRIRLREYARRFRRGETVVEQWILLLLGKPQPLNCLCSGVLVDDERLAMLVECQNPADTTRLENQQLRAVELLRHTTALNTMFAADGTRLFQNPAASEAFEELGFVECFTDAATGKLVWESVWANGYFLSQLLLRTGQGERWFAVEGRIVPDPVSGQRVLVWTGLDIDEQQRTALASRARLRASEARLRAILASLSEGVVVHGADGAIVERNPAAQRLLAPWIPDGAVQGESSGAFEPACIRPDGSPFPAEEHPAMVSLRSGRAVNGVVMGLTRPGDSLEQALWLQINSTPVTVGDDRVESVVASFADISGLKRTEMALALEKQRLAVTLRSIGDAVIATDAEGRVEYLNPVAEQLTGWPLMEARGQPLMAVFRVLHEADDSPIRDPWERCLREGRAISLDGDCVLLDRTGKRRAIDDSAAPITDPNGRVEGVVLVFRDVTEERRQQREMHFQANHDPLTGLPNRREFETRLQRVVRDAHERHTEHVLCYLDLDRFKPVNDTCGHAAGDEMLRQLTALCRTHCRKRDTLARIGGDEFGLLLEHCTLDQARRVVEQVLQAVIGFEFLWEEHRFTIGVSIGMVGVDRESPDSRQLLRDVDTACYRAKADGGNQVHVYRRGDSRLAADFLATRLFTDNGETLALERLRLLAQPVVDLHDGHWPGMELLLRWEDGEGRLQRPASFFGLAERQALCARFDSWVVEQVCAFLAEQARQGRAAPVCWINLFSQTLAVTDFGAVVEAALDASGIAGDRLGFEIAENTLVGQRSAAVRLMDRLRPRGCRFILDNCGGGSVVFSELRYLPVDYIKVRDRLIRDSGTDPVAARVLTAVVEVTRLLGRRVVALGVEDARTLERLRTLGFDACQGFHLGRPRPLATLLAQKR